MADWSELKRLAEESKDSGDWFEEGCALYSYYEKVDADFIVAASPDVVLALIAENAATESRLHEVAVACATAEQERDRLKTENERLRRIISDSATACGAAMSTECTTEFMGYLPAEIAGALKQLKAGLAAEQRRAAVLEQNCAELAEELERVRADAERYRFLHAGESVSAYAMRFDEEGDVVIHGAELDTAIDAAMGKGGGQNGSKTAETRASAGLEGGGHGSKGTGGHSAENQAEARANAGVELASKGGRADG